MVIKTFWEFSNSCKPAIGQKAAQYNKREVSWVHVKSRRTFGSARGGKKQQTDAGCPSLPPAGQVHSKGTKLAGYLIVEYYCATLTNGIYRARNYQFP